MMVRLESEKIVFSVLSGMLLHLNIASAPHRSILVRLYNQTTLGYTTQTPIDAPALDQRVEVLQDRDGRLNLRANGLLLTPRGLAGKLVELITAPGD